MDIEENLKLRDKEDCMNKKIMKRILGTTSFLMFGLLLIMSQIVVNAVFYPVEVISKSPLLPYDDYDYMTTDVTLYRINNKDEAIPNYFRTDFASIPSAFWSLEAPYKSNLVYAAIWHDYNYSCPNGRERKEIDDIFYSLLIKEGTPAVSALSMYIAVRLFGGSHFFRNGLCDEIVIHEMEQDELLYKEEVVDYD